MIDDFLDLSQLDKMYRDRDSNQWKDPHWLSLVHENMAKRSELDTNDYNSILETILQHTRPASAATPQGNRLSRDWFLDMLYQAERYNLYKHGTNRQFDKVMQENNYQLDEQRGLGINPRKVKQLNNPNFWMGRRWM